MFKKIENFEIMICGIHYFNLRRRSNVVQMLYKCFVFTGKLLPAELQNVAGTSVIFFVSTHKKKRSKRAWLLRTPFHWSAATAHTLSMTTFNRTQGELSSLYYHYYRSLFALKRTFITSLLCNAKRQYLLTFEVSGCCLSGFAWRDNLATFMLIWTPISICAIWLRNIWKSFEVVWDIDNYFDLGWVKYNLWLFCSQV